MSKREFEEGAWMRGFRSDSSSISNSSSSSSSSSSSCCGSSTVPPVAGIFKRAKPTQNTKPILLLAPSAGGRPPKEVKQCLSELCRLIIVTDENSGNWKNKIYNSTKNRDLLLSVARGVAQEISHKANPPKVLLAGTSFGCRVISDVLTHHRSLLPSCIEADSALFIGYPLHGPSASANDRVTPLYALPPTTRVTFISGDNDEFLQRSYLPDDSRGIATLQEVKGNMQAISTIVSLEGGKHNPLQVAKSKVLQRTKEFNSAVNAHFSTCFE